MALGRFEHGPQMLVNVLWKQLVKTVTVAANVIFAAGFHTRHAPTWALEQTHIVDALNTHTGRLTLSNPTPCRMTPSLPRKLLRPWPKINWGRRAVQC